jgi:hypothetical protein
MPKESCQDHANFVMAPTAHVERHAIGARPCRQPDTARTAQLAVVKQEPACWIYHLSCQRARGVHFFAVATAMCQKFLNYCTANMA